MSHVMLNVLLMGHYLKPTRQGYFCDDASIRYPYKEGTISMTIVVLCGSLIPLTVVFLTAIWAFGFRSRITIWRLELPEWLTQCVTVCSSYIVGIALSQIICNAGKALLGRLRPHFIDVCKSTVSCENSTQPSYILKYDCAGDPKKVIEARRSFPSGHAAISFYMAIYVIIYMQNSKTWARYVYLKGLLQFLLLLLAWCISLTRIMDYWHHWSDVIAGAMIGIISAYLAAKYLPGLHDNKTQEEGYTPPQTAPPQTAPPQTAPPQTHPALNFVNSP